MKTPTTTLGLFMRTISGDDMAPVLGCGEKPFPASWNEFKFATSIGPDSPIPRWSGGTPQPVSIDPEMHGHIHINRKAKQVLLYTPFRIEHPESHAAIISMLRGQNEINDDDSDGWIVCCRDAVWRKSAELEAVKLALETNPTWGFMLVDYQEGSFLEHKFNGRDNISFYWMGETLAYADRVDPGDRNLIWELRWPAFGIMKDRPKEQLTVLKAQLLALIDKFACRRLVYTATTPFVLREFPSLGVMLIPDPTGQTLELTMGVGDQEGSINICFGGTDMGWIYWNKHAELDVEWRMPDSVCSDTIKAQLLTIAKNGDFYPTQPF